MSASSQSIEEPYYKEFLRCAKCLHHFEYENSSYHPITLPICGHTMCRRCIREIGNQTKCSQDGISFGINNTSIVELPINYPLLILLDESSKLPEDNERRYGQYLSDMQLDDETKVHFNTIQDCLGKISNYIKPIINNKECQSKLSRSVIRKVFSLLHSQYIVREGRLKALEAARSLGHWTCIYFIHSHQNRQQVQQLIAELWSKVRSQNFAFLGSAKQENVLKLILSAVGDDQQFEYCDFVSKVLLPEVRKQNPDLPDSDVISVMLLLRCASCFQEVMHEGGVRMRLMAKFRDYESLRLAHDSHIIQIAMKHGLRISPEEWSSLLYDDTRHESLIQSIIDQLLTPASFSQSIKDFLNAAIRAGQSSSYLLCLQNDFDFLSKIRIENDVQQANPMWSSTIHALGKVENVLKKLIEFPPPIL